MHAWRTFGIALSIIAAAAAILLAGCARPAEVPSPSPVVPPPPPEEKKAQPRVAHESLLPPLESDENLEMALAQPVL